MCVRVRACLKQDSSSASACAHPVLSFQQRTRSCASAHLTSRALHDKLFFYFQWRRPILDGGEASGAALSCSLVSATAAFKKVGINRMTSRRKSKEENLLDTDFVGQSLIFSAMTRM